MPYLLNPFEMYVVDLRDQSMCVTVIHFSRHLFDSFIDSQVVNLLPKKDFNSAIDPSTGQRLEQTQFLGKPLP